MQKKIVGILICIFFVISIFSFATNAKISYIQEKNHQQKLNELIFLNNPPYIPSNPDPANESVNVNITTNLSWTGGDPDPDDTVTYNIFFGTDPNPPIAVIVHYGETYDPGKLNYDTQYYWKIDAYDGTTATDGPIWTFHTKDGAPPYVPSNPDPANESVNVNITTNLSWTGGDPDPDDTVTYNIFFGTDPNPPIAVIVHYGETYDPGKLNYDTQYYWKIDAYDGTTATDGPIWTFHTKDGAPPYVPSNPDPANESVNVNITTNLSWTGGDPDPDDTVTYNIFFGTDPNPPNVETNYTDTTYNPSGLTYNTQYYWRIDAWDDYNYSTTGPIWMFHTKEGAPPYVPSNPDPANESTNIHITTNLSWTGGDPDDDPVKYDIYFGTDPNPPNVETNYTDTTYNPSRLTYNTQYYWRIDAWDDYNYSTTGPIWTFTTTSSNNPPNKPSRPSGPTNGRTFTSYTYSSSTTDPDGDELYYMFDWDDGRLPEWIGPIDSGQDIIVTHTWTAQGTYNIKVRAMDEHGSESEWSDPLSISMPKNKAVAKNKAKGVFQADLGLGNEGDAKISLNGQYRTFGSFRIFGGTGNLTGTDKTGRFQGLSTRSYFIIQTAVNSQIINIVGKYTSYNEEEQTFNGICRGLTGRIRGTTGWITGSFS